MSRPTDRRIAFVLASTSHGTMLVNRQDHAREADQEYGVGHQLLTTSAYDPEEIAIFSTLITSRRAAFGDGVVVIDCGANIGVHTLEFAKQLHGWGEVIGIEAQERIFYALAGNVALNNCFNARVLWAAVGAESGTMGVPVPDYFTPSSFGSLELRQSERTENIGQTVDYSEAKLAKTPMVAIDDLGLTRIDLIKIDIEGMELDALIGARKSIEAFRPQLAIERVKTDEQAITAMLTPLGYKFFPFGLNLLAIHENDPIAAQIVVKPA